ncbi:molecular chaperone GrpE [Trichormus sp. NMC-1]|uniref:nucleotide exchange factor GrpE n=1 Tax=Trichormus sp. NMC-1 TaxID=1853259 RepID=UPI0008DBF4F2|nr:molecular chaperone GrpE [Trichormus sp. NMC-1]
MLEQVNNIAFAVILVFIVYIILRILFPETNENKSINNQSVISPDTEQKINDLEIQCQRLREELKQQSQQLQDDFQYETFTQLQTLLSNYPTVKKMALAKPELPAKNLVSLFTSLDNLITNWGYTAIGETWEQVNYNPQLHQADSDDIQEGELVYIRFIGYQNGDKILYPAKVSRTLPGGFN